MGEFMLVVFLVSPTCHQNDMSLNVTWVVCYLKWHVVKVMSPG